jgi:hypothetical protein
MRKERKAFETMAKTEERMGDGGAKIGANQ